MNNATDCEVVFQGCVWESEWMSNPVAVSGLGSLRSD